MIVQRRYIYIYFSSFTPMTQYVLENEKLEKKTEWMTGQNFTFVAFPFTSWKFPKRHSCTRYQHAFSSNLVITIFFFYQFLQPFTFISSLTEYHFFLHHTANRQTDRHASTVTLGKSSIKIATAQCYTLQGY